MALVGEFRMMSSSDIRSKYSSWYPSPPPKKKKKKNSKKKICSGLAKDFLFLPSLEKQGHTYIREKEEKKKD